MKAGFPKFTYSRFYSTAGFFLSNTYWPSIHGDINQPRYPPTDSHAVPFRVSALEVTLAPPGFQEELKGSLRSNI